MDIAALGLSVDSGPAERAVAALRQLPGAARAAAAGADQLAGSAEREARAFMQSTSALNDNARAAQVAGAARRAMSQQMANTFAGVRDDFGSDARRKDIEAYGRELDNLRAKYNPLFAAGRQYKETLQEISQAARVGALSEKERADAVQRTKDAFAVQVRGLRATEVANSAIAKSGGLARHEMINLSRQVQDIGVSLASGQSPFTVLVQQGTQVGDIFANTNGTMRGFASQIASIITPMRLLGVGIVAIGAAAYAGYSYWKSFALSLDDTARIAGITTREMAQLQAVASFKGISQDDLASGVKSFSAALYEARSGAGELYVLLRDNKMVAGEFSQTLEKVLGLVSRASGDVGMQFSLLRQAGLPANMEWIRLAENIQKAKNDAVAFGGAANDNMVRKAREVDEAWNRFWTNFSFGARHAFVEVTRGLSDLGGEGSAYKQIVDYLSSKLSTAPARYGYRTKVTVTPRPTEQFGPPIPEPRPVDPMAEENRRRLAAESLQLEQQRLQLLGELTTESEKLRLVEIGIAQARLNPRNKITDDDVARIRDYAREQEKVGRLRETVGILGEAATEAQRYAARIGELGLALHANKISQDDFNRAVAYANPLFAGAASTLENNLTSGLASIVDGTKSAKDAFRDMSMAIISEINQMIIKLMIVRPLINGLAGGFGGMFGGNSPGAPSNYAGYNMTGLPGSANGNVFSGGNVIPFARGGIVDRATIFPMARGYGLMGEAEPEAVMPLRRGQDGKLGVVAAGSGGPRMVVNVINNAGSDIQARPQSQPRQNSDGSISLDVVIERAVRNAVNSDVANNGPMTQGLARRFNLNSANGLA